jgi:hypothetical protein
MRARTVHFIHLPRLLLIAAVLFFACAPSSTKNPPDDVLQPKPAPVSHVDTGRPVLQDYVKINGAACRGAEWLRDRWRKGLPVTQQEIPGVIPEGARMNELAFVAISRWGAIDLSSDEANAQVVYERATPPANTFSAAVRAMLLCSMSPSLQGDVVQCVQYLVDTQGQDGSWGVGKEIPLPPVPERVDKTGLGRLTAVRVTVKRRTWGEPGDRTNTVWAINGLIHACRMGVFPSSDSMASLDKRLSDAQNEDGGWGESKGRPSDRLATATGMWSLSISLRLNGTLKPRNDDRVRRATLWLDSDLARQDLPERGDARALFCVYMLGQAAEVPGGRELKTLPTDYWKERIVDWLLRRQNPDGSWGGEESERVYCTSLALLALPTGARIQWWILPDPIPPPKPN